jgi:CMP/dCMP kinase
LRLVFYLAAAMCAVGAAALVVVGRRKPAVARVPVPEPQPAAPATDVRVVTISRQYGGGGGEIGARLARRLGWQLLDHEVVQRVAEELHLTEPEAEKRDECAEPFIARLLASMGPLDPLLLNDRPAGLAHVDVYRDAVRRVLESAARIGQVVIIGRGAMVALAGRPDVLHVRVVAPLPQRIAYVAYREGLSPAAAEQRLLTKDRDRKHNLWVTYGRRLDDECLYDLIFNTGALDLDTVVDEICLALQRKTRSLTTARNGASAGYERYPGQPKDFQAASIVDRSVPARSGI